MEIFRLTRIRAQSHGPGDRAIGLKIGTNGTPYHLTVPHKIFEYIFTEF